MMRLPSGASFNLHLRTHSLRPNERPTLYWRERGRHPLSSRLCLQKALRFHPDTKDAPEKVREILIEINGLRAVLKHC